MPEKPAHASGYPSGHLEKIRQTCLYVATKLGDLADDLVVVGGLAPSLLVDQNHLPQGAERHVGTLDLDFGLGLAILDASKYQAIVERLREAEFTPDKKDGKVVRQRWGLNVSQDERLTVEFLIPPSNSNDRPGSLRNLEGEFAAIVFWPPAYRAARAASKNRDESICRPSCPLPCERLRRRRSQGHPRFELDKDRNRFRRGERRAQVAIIPVRRICTGWSCWATRRSRS